MNTNEGVYSLNEEKTPKKMGYNLQDTFIELKHTPDHFWAE